MLFSDNPVILRGGGDLATGVAYRLHKAGFPIIVLELPRPLVVRRRVALATAMLEGEITVEDLRAVRVETPGEALTLAYTGAIPVLAAPDLSQELTDGPRPMFPGQSPLATDHSPLLVDARLAKRNIDTRIDQAPLVVALGPGFTAGVDCHAVIETKRGHRLGRVIRQGNAEPDTGIPGTVGGKGAERVLRAPADGLVHWDREIGDRVRAGETLGLVADQVLLAPFDGVVRGLIAPGTPVTAGLKIGDIDARGDVAACFTISDKSLSVGGGVLEAILTYLSSRENA